MIVLRRRAHERQINVDVRIDESRENIFPDGIDHFRITRRLNIRLNARDRFAVAKNVRDVLFVRRNNLAVLNEK